MPRYVAFLRAINVGGRVVKMDRLRKLFEKLGLANVETFIASGNVIFESKATDTRALTKKIEARLNETLGYEVATFLRTAAEVERISRHQPFTESALASATSMVVGLLSEPPMAASVKTLMALRTDTDDFSVNGTEIYWLLRQKQSESNLTNATFEKVLKVRATLRGAKTIVKLAAKYSPANAGSR